MIDPLDPEEPLVQDLSAFRLPPDFRGRSGFVTQLWWIVQSTLFRLSPQVMYGWRRWLLRLFGAKIGDKVLIRPGVRVTYPWKLSVGRNSWIGDGTEIYNLGSIHIGRNVCISQGVSIVSGSHNFHRKTFDICAEPIKIEDECWVCAGAFIHQGVTLGRGCVIGARAVVNKSTARFSINVGAPARAIGHRRPQCRDTAC